MAKKNDVSCPLCKWKGDPGGRQFPPHLADDGSVCLMATRPVPERENQGPVTSGSGPSTGPTTAGNVTPGGAGGTTTTP